MSPNKNPICQHHKFVFCKFKNHCKKENTEEKCQDRSACRNIKSCNKRHLKVCKQYILERFCKFGRECSYEHIITAIDHNNSLEAKKIEVLENNAKIQLEGIEHLEEEIKTMKSILEKSLKAFLKMNIMKVRSLTNSKRLKLKVCINVQIVIINVREI